MPETIPIRCISPRLIDPSAPANAREIAAGATVTAPRVLDTNGVLYTRRATAWQQTLTGVRALATQLGVG